MTVTRCRRANESSDATVLGFSKSRMKRSTARILTTHVGSLIRPPALDRIPARPAGAASRSTKRPSQRACTASVAEVVRQQAEAGIDVVSDGEFGKTISWSQYALERLSGFERRPMQAGANPFARGADRTRFAEFYAELDAREAPATRSEVGLRRPDRLYRPGRAPARHRQLQGGAGKGRASPRRSCRSRRPRASSPTARTSITRATRTACRRSPRRCAPNTA